MTIWMPQIRPDGPRYQAIADAIARDVGGGLLAPGARLPTHRALATRIGVTVGTVSRAYDEAARLGLIRGEVGRGTFVCPPAGGLDAGDGVDLDVDLSRNVARADVTATPLQAALSELAGEARLGELLDYAPAAGHEAHRHAGAQWLRLTGMPADPESVIVTSGAQHALSVALTATAQPGDRVLAAELTYPGMTSLASQLRLRLDGVALDERPRRGLRWARPTR